MRIAGTLTLILVTTSLGLGCEVEECSDSRSPLTVQFDVAVLVKDSSLNPLGGQLVEADVFKATCSGDVKRVAGAPWTGVLGRNSCRCCHRWGCARALKR